MSESREKYDLRELELNALHRAARAERSALDLPPFVPVDAFALLVLIETARSAQDKAHEFDSGWDGGDGSGIHGYDAEHGPDCRLCAALALFEVE